MSINMGAAILNLDGSETNDGADGKVLTVGRVVASALNQIPPDRAGENDDRVTAGLLAMQCYKETGSIDLTSEEVTLIKRAVKAQPIPTNIVAQVISAVDPASLSKR